MDASLYAAFKQAINAETDSTFVALRNANETGQMAAWYNGATTFVVWRSQSPTADLFNAITWANLTPTDAPDGTATYTNRALHAQAKQINLQTILQGQDYIATGRANVRAGLQDALTNLYTGTGGVVVGGNWAGVKTAIQRACNRAERVWATGTGTAATPGDLGAFEGSVSNDDIVHALQS